MVERILYPSDIIFLLTLYFNSNKRSLFLWQKVYYHAGGLRLNPNLYASGKVCLSLLNTWFGRKKEKWTPGVSTMLQVLVSIQGLILNAKPYFNEPGFANTSGTQIGEARSLEYNENTFILSVRTMMYTMKKPPKVCFC
jgi:ubiquitin-conjugating enzyme E2 O